MSEETLDDAARRLHSEAYPGGVFENIKEHARLSWYRAAWEERGCLAALPSVPVGGLGARPKAVVPTEGQDAAVVGHSVYLSAVAGRMAFRDAFRRCLPVVRAAEALAAKWTREGQKVDSDDFYAAIHDVCEAAIKRNSDPTGAADVAFAAAAEQAAISDDKQPGTEASEGRCSEPNLPTEDAAGGRETWHGGEQPVADDVLVEVRFRDGSEGAEDASWWHWNSKHSPIIAYRIAAPTTPASLDGGE